MILNCLTTNPPHTHSYPDDWDMGVYGIDPRADPRYQPSVYTYYDADTTELWRTVVPICDDEALDYFTEVAKIKGSNPQWVAVKRPGEKHEMLPFLYNKSTDTVYPR